VGKKEEKKEAGVFTVDCPHCRATLSVDAGLQAVLGHEPPPSTTDFDFDQQLQGLSEAERKRAALFTEQVAAQQKRSELLDAKFKESFEKRKHEPVTKPIRDFELD